VFASSAAAVAIGNSDRVRRYGKEEKGRKGRGARPALIRRRSSSPASTVTEAAAAAVPSMVKKEMEKNRLGFWGRG
jgi:hypothetical protein